MPSPPKEGETGQAFISRCIAHLMSKEGKTKEQAAGQCYGMLRQKRGKKTLMQGNG